MTGAFLITPVIMECLHRITGLQFKTLHFESQLCFLPHVFFILAQEPPVGQDLLIHEVSRSHSMTHHSR